MNTDHFKKLLQDEYTVLENELKSVSRKNPDNPSDWEGVEPSGNENAAEDGDVASGIEEYEDNVAITNRLESRLLEVQGALKKIEDGTYGTCSVCGEKIETDRLEANPAAQTCKLHME